MLQVIRRAPLPRPLSNSFRPRLHGLRHYSKPVSYSLFKENSLKNLIQDLSSSIQETRTENNVKIREVMNLLRYYQSKKEQWTKYALRDKDNNYTRNLVTNIKTHSNLLVLLWEPGKQSNIHGHPNTHCFMKILKGQLQEKLFDPTSSESDRVLKRTTTLPTNSVAYITDELGLHQMKNPAADIAVSLHLYVPKYEAGSGVNLEAVKNESENLGFYSIDGEIVQK